MMAHVAGLSEAVEEQTKKLTEMCAVMTNFAEQQNKALWCIKHELQSIRKCEETSVVKLSCMEARDCGQQGEGTDAARLADQWCRGQSY